LKEDYVAQINETRTFISVCPTFVSERATLTVLCLRSAQLGFVE